LNEIIVSQIEARIGLGSAPGYWRWIKIESSGSSGSIVDSGLSNRLLEYFRTDSHPRDRDGFEDVQTAPGHLQPNEMVIDGQIAT